MCEYISTYTRKEAIEDNVLIDMSKEARGTFGCPVSITSTAFNGVLDAIGWKTSVTGIVFAKTMILTRLLQAVKKKEVESTEVIFLVNGFELKSIVHGGDNNEMVLSIMLPDED